MKTLVIPPAAQRDPKSVQMLSAWVAEKGLHCSLNIGMWQADGRNEPKAWGILLADVVRHIANALQEESGVPAEKTIAEVAASISQEIESPTSKVTGGFSPGHS